MFKLSLKERVLACSAYDFYSENFNAVMGTRYYHKFENSLQLRINFLLTNNADHLNQILFEKLKDASFYGKVMFDKTFRTFLILDKNLTENTLVKFNSSYYILIDSNEIYFIHTVVDLDHVIKRSIECKKSIRNVLQISHGFSLAEPVEEATEGLPGIELVQDYVKFLLRELLKNHYYDDYSWIRDEDLLYPEERELQDILE